MFLLWKKVSLYSFMARLRYILLCACAVFAAVFAIEQEGESEIVVNAVCSVAASFEVSDDSEELAIAHRANSLFRTPQSIQSVESCRTVVSRGFNSMTQDVRRLFSLPLGRAYAYGCVETSVLMHIPCHILHHNFRL